MQTDPSSSYPDRVRAWIRTHGQDPEIRAQLDQYAEIVTVLLSLDLEPARALLALCYAASPRGGDPWDPIVVFRCLLIALLAGISSINKLVPVLRGSRVLRMLAGLPDVVGEGETNAPGVGTFYDFLHRVHDGPLPRGVIGYIRPSQVERDAAKAPRLPGNEARRSKKNKGRTAPEEDTPDGKPSDRALQKLRQTRASRCADDLLGRMSDLLWVLAVRPSAQQGLLGDVLNLVVAGDGSPLVTGACGLGTRLCRCDRKKTCDCPRTYADPDARVGWDAYRRRYFYGHHFYEICVPFERHDLPLLLRLDPANATDHVAGLYALESLEKKFRDTTEGWKIDCFIADCGHDGSATYALCDDHQIRPVIPLNGAPALHPARPDLKLSPNAIPLCQPARPGPRRDGRLGLQRARPSRLHLPGQGQKDRLLPPTRASRLVSPALVWFEAHPRGRHGFVSAPDPPPEGCRLEPPPPRATRAGSASPAPPPAPSSTSPPRTIPASSPTRASRLVFPALVSFRGSPSGGDTGSCESCPVNPRGLSPRRASRSAGFFKPSERIGSPRSSVTAPPSPTPTDDARPASAATASRRGASSSRTPATGEPPSGSSGCTSSPSSSTPWSGSPVRTPGPSSESCSSPRRCPPAERSSTP